MGRHPQMRRRSLSAGAIAVRRMRRARLVTLPSPGEPRARRASARRRPGVLSLHVRSGERQRNRTARSHRRGHGRAPSANTCDTETSSGADMQASKPREARHEQTRENRRGQAERTGGRGAGGLDATTFERLIVKGLTPLLPGHRQRGAQRAGRGRAAAAGTVSDVIAATVEHACTTRGAEMQAWTQARVLPETARPVKRGTALANAPAAFIRHTCSSNRENLDERGGERHVLGRSRERERASSSCSTG